MSGHLVSDTCQLCYFFKVTHHISHPYITKKNLTFSTVTLKTLLKADRSLNVFRTEQQQIFPYFIAPPDFVETLVYMPFCCCF